MANATVTAKGQITLPKPVREHLGVKPGHRVEFVIDDAGQVFVVAVTKDIGELRGMLGKPPRSLTPDEIEAYSHRDGQPE